MYCDKFSSLTMPASRSSTYAASMEIGCALELCRIEGNVVEQPLHDRVKSTRADIFLPLVDGKRDFSQPSHALGLEVDIDALGGEQGLVLPRQAGVGRGEESARSRRPSSDASSTRIGKRPCNSGIRSDGLAK